MNTLMILLRSSLQTKTYTLTRVYIQIVKTVKACFHFMLQSEDSAVVKYFIRFKFKMQKLKKLLTRKKWFAWEMSIIVTLIIYHQRILKLKYTISQIQSTQLNMITYFELIIDSVMKQNPLIKNFRWFLYLQTIYKHYQKKIIKHNIIVEKPFSRNVSKII